LNSKTLEQYLDIFKRADATNAIITDRQFWTEVEILKNILVPAKQAVKGVEYKTATLGSVYVELLKMAKAIKEIPNVLNSEFKKTCINIYNKRWAQFDSRFFILVYFFHPYYRGKLFIFLFYL
jgi:hypothetical protein